MKNIALITGASKGIGKELAHIHAKMNGDVILVARSNDKLIELKHELEENYHIKAYVIVQDLSEKHAAKIIYDTIKDMKLDIDILINNAGFGGLSLFHKQDLQTIHDMIQLNITALTELTHYFLADFTKRNRGKILNVSSTASLAPGPLQAVYYATKAFVTSFSNAIAAELSETKITVTALLPGPVDTHFAKEAKMENTSLFKKASNPTKVALKGYKAMAKGKLNKIAGANIFLRIGFLLLPIAPIKLQMMVIKKIHSSI